MTPSGPGAIIIDATTVSFMLMALTGILGLARGARAEGITLAGLLATAITVTNEGLGQRLVDLANNAAHKAGRILDLVFSSGETGLSGQEQPLIATSDQRFAFYLAIFVLVTLLFYLAGSALGGHPSAAGQRLVGGILGVSSGLVLSLTLINFNQNYTSLYGGLGEIAINIPVVISPQLPQTNPFAPYLPWVLLSALIIIVALAILFMARSRKAKS